MKTNNTVFVVYCCDNWHSYVSMELIGVATDMLNAIALVKKQAKEEGAKISKDDLYNLQYIKQTQGYKGEGEFYLKEITLNELV